MAKKNVIAKFKTFYEKLDFTEQRHLYDLLSIIRGPDSDALSALYELGVLKESSDKATPADQ